MCEYPPGLILIVTGSTPRAEQMDRPLAYYLQTQIEQLGAGYEERQALVRGQHDGPAFGAWTTLRRASP